MRITTTQSTNIMVTHNAERETLVDLYDIIYGFRGDTQYCLNLPTQKNPEITLIFITNMEVSENGVTDDSFEESVQQFIETLTDAGFTVLEN